MRSVGKGVTRNALDRVSQTVKITTRRSRVCCSIHIELVNFANVASESCFLLQHVEQHGREEQSDPWSIRQTGVYHRSDKALNQDTDLIVNPSDRLQERLKELKASTSAAADVSLLLMSTTTRNWRPYLDYLESRLDILVSPGAIASR
jgi:hypothetical protein